MNVSVVNRRWLAVLAILCLWLTAEAQVESQLSYRRYTIQDGLPRMQTERVWQDSRGYIYIGTLSGFVRFDGRTFTPFLKGRRENIVGFAEVGGRVRALSFARQWIVVDDEVTPRLFDPQKQWFLNNFNAGSLTGDYVLMENEMEENRRLCHMTDEGFTPVLKGALLDEMTPDRKLFVDSTNIYYVPTERGLFRISGKRAVRISAKSDIYTLLRTDAGLLAFAADGIYNLEVRGKGLEVRGKRLETPFHFPLSTFGLTVRRLKSGSLVIADEHAVYVYDGKTISQVISGLNMVKDLLVDRWDRLWVATYQGLYCFFNRNFTNHRLSDQDDIVRAIGTDGEGRLVTGTLNGKILTDGDVTDDDNQQFYAPNSATVDGCVYMAGNGCVVCVGPQGPQTLPLPKTHYQFVSAAEDRLIVGSRKGILRYDPQTDAVDTLSTEILHPWCAATDAQGVLWIGSSPGLYSIAKDGAVSKTDYPQKLIITTMAADMRSPSLGKHIFFASADSLFMIRNGQVEAVSSQIPELTGHEVRSLHVSPRGFLIIAVIDGLFVCRLDTEGRLSDIRFYNHQNGFTALEPQMATMAETADGTVWLAGVEEMTSFRPEALYEYNEEDTYIAPPLRWWQHWWVWLIGLVVLSLAVWGAARWYEKRRNYRRMIKLQGEKMEKERQIDAIRKKALEAEPTPLAQDIVKMTEKSKNTRVNIRTVKGTVILDTADIAYFKADGNYTQMVTFNGSDTIQTGIGTLTKMLDPKIFVRADRSTLVNIHNIERLDPHQRLCTFRSADGVEVDTSLLAPAFKRLEQVL